MTIFGHRGLENGSGSESSERTCLPFYKNNRALSLIAHAGRIGYSTAYTKIGIYVDGVKLGTYAGTSPGGALSALNWQKLLYGFTGTGGPQTLRIVSEATAYDANGRGAMLDDIALTEVLPANSGREDTAIRLSAIQAQLRDTDGSEALSVHLNALPVGARLSDGLQSFTATAGNTSVDITNWNQANLWLTPPANFAGTVSLQVVATATETATNTSATTTATLAVRVLSVNDAPIALDATVTVKRNNEVRLDFANLVSDVDGNVLTLSFANPMHGSLVRNSDGTYTYRPAWWYTGTDVITYTVSDGMTSTTGEIDINVVAHYPPGTSGATVTVISEGGNTTATGPGAGGAPVQYVVVNQTSAQCWTGGQSGSQLSLNPTAASAPVINWSGTSSLPITGLEQQTWVTGFLGIRSAQEDDLAALTGLRVVL